MSEATPDSDADHFGDEEDFDESEILDQQQPEDTLIDRGVDDVLDEEEIGLERSGRIVDPDEGTGTEQDLLGEDVGIDAGAAGAEEAAVHTVDEE